MELASESVPSGLAKPSAVENEIVIEDTGPPLLPVGDYQAKYIHHETSKAFGNTQKVYVHFEIIDPGPHNGARLYRAYRVSEILGKPRKNGRFKLKRRCDLFLTLCRLHDGKLRPDQVSLKGLKDLVLKISVRTVTTDYKQRPLPHMLHYSVVDDIKEICAGAKPRLTVINS